MQQVIATAEQVAAGGSNDPAEENGQAKPRLLSLFEQIRLTDKSPKLSHHADFKQCYPLLPLTADSIFPQTRAAIEPNNDETAQQQYLALWENFVAGLAKIPSSHRNQWELWLDHFDTAYQCFTSAIPSATAFGVKPEVSLYDHSKTTVALATALWRSFADEGKTDAAQAAYLKNREQSWADNKFLLIQGDFFGIQDFIFSGDSQTNKQAAKLLRGRSFQVSLFCELAALKLLQACHLRLKL